MRILVCVKQAPDPGAVITIDESGHWIRVSETTALQMSRFDEYAVEQALQIREQIPGATVDVVSVGPGTCAAVVKRGLGMGADHGIHVLTNDEGYVSPLRTAYRIALATRDRRYDLILTGVMSEDMCQGVVGPMLAETLGVQCATWCIQVRVEDGGSSVYVEREIEGGRRQAFVLDLPALLTLQSGINKPRYPSVSHIMRATRQELEVIPADEADPGPGCEDILGMSYPEKSRECLFLEGSRKDKASRLLRIFRERSLLR